MKNRSDPTAGGTFQSRREFLKATTATAAAVVSVPYIITSSALGAEGRPPASDRVVMGAIGVGGRGTGNMRGFMGFGQVQMVAVCDVKKPHRDRAKGHVDGRYKNTDCKAYVDFRELVVRDDIDAVCVGTPDHWHAINVIQACRHGKDAFCEKPLTLTVREGRVMVETARRFGRVVSSGSQRVIGDYGRLAREVRSGIIGEVKQAYVNVGGPPRDCYLPGQPIPDSIDWEMWLGPAPWAPYHPYRCGAAYGLGGKGFRTWRDYSGGMMTDWGGHKFGGALYGLDKMETGPVEVIPPDGKDHKYLTYVYADGVRLYHSPGYGSITYKGTHGQVPGHHTGEAHPCTIQNYKGSRGILGDFLHCVRTRERPFRDVERGHRAATICHLGNIAYETGLRFKWDPVKEVSPDCEEASRLCRRAKREPWTL